MAFALNGSVSLAGESLLSEVKLDFPVGWTCILGRSGSGKSTLLRLIAGLDTPAVLNGGRSIPDRVGWMGQSDLLLARRSVRANVQLMARLRGTTLDRRAADTLLSAVGLAKKGSALPSTLSGGQRQRVALARVLSEDAGLVLLDEPFGALDPATRISMQNLAHKTLVGRRVVMVTHDPFEALRLADKIYLLEDGRSREHSPLPAQKPVAVNNPELVQAAADLLQEMVTLQ